MPLPPDADLYKDATGLAKELVDKHQEEQSLVLYAGWFCPFVQRIWIILEEKNIPYQYVETNPYHKPESLMKLNPRGLVPTLQYHDRPLYESIVVAEFLEEAYPDHGPKLLPPDPYWRAISRIWIDFVTSRFIPAFHRFLQHQPGTSTSLEQVRSEFLDILKQFTKEMHPEGPYFLGSEISLVDITIAPWEVRFWIFDHFKGGLGIPAEGQGGEDEKIWARWRKWSTAINERKSFKETMSDKDHYIPIYQRYAEDTAQSELAKATRQGRGVP